MCVCRKYVGVGAVQMCWVKICVCKCNCWGTLNITFLVSTQCEHQATAAEEERLRAEELQANEHQKRQRLCKKCNLPMKGHNKKQCENQLITIYVLVFNLDFILLLILFNCYCLLMFLITMCYMLI